MKKSQNIPAERPVTDIELLLRFDSEGTALDDTSVELAAQLIIKLTGDDSGEIVKDIQKNLTIEQLTAVLSDALADAFAGLFGLQIIDDGATVN